ncbi:MAG: heavy-metal-associated domain-containing protein [Clostridia bacterium]|nr:heavy-metal-associated domain-containing protein [Clostridia bacterium]
MKLVVRMEDLDCAHCAQKMEDKICKLSGVESVSVSFMAQKMILQITEGTDKDDLLSQIEKTVKSVDKNCSIVR